MLAEKALEHRIIFGLNNLIEYSEIGTVKQAPCTLSPAQISAIVNAMKIVDAKTVFTVLDECFTFIYNNNTPNINEVKNSIIELAILIIKETVKNTVVMQSVFGRIVQPAVELESMETIGDVEVWIREIVGTLLYQPALFNFYSYSPLVQQVVNFIMSNYSAPITINDVAEKLYISPAILCGFLKGKQAKPSRSI